MELGALENTMKLEPLLIIFLLSLTLLVIFNLLNMGKGFQEDWERGQFQIIQQSYLSGNTIAFQVVGKVRATITGYSSCPEETDDTPFITASGSRTRLGVIACPKYYGFGQILRIDGEYYVCEDRMNVRYPHRFDIWFPDKISAINWGIKSKVIEIIK